MGRLLMPMVYNFLFLNKAISTKTMVLEGWVPTYALQKVIKDYKYGEYENLIVTGIPITQYEYASEFNYTSQATIQALKHFGFTDTIYEADITTNIYKDRTYTTALVATKIFKQHPEWKKSFNIYSMGVHSRRSRLLFKKAFPDDYEIGIIAQSDRTFIGEKWWTSSIGFRNISNETLAYFYNLFFFHPKEIEYNKKLRSGFIKDNNENERRKKYYEFSDTLTSPFNKQEIENHKDFKYFDVDEDFYVETKFIVDTTHPPFEMPTTTKRRPIYRIYAHLNFNIHDTLLSLVAYQNMENRNHPEYGNSLFIPFTDLTNGISTYGGGRYLDINIPNSDSLFLDFNKAYNPYCAYSKRWSCPLVPFDNHLDIKITAGERKYK